MIGIKDPPTESTARDTGPLATKELSFRQAAGVMRIYLAGVLGIGVMAAGYELMLMQRRARRAENFLQLATTGCGLSFAVTLCFCCCLRYFSGIRLRIFNDIYLAILNIIPVAAFLCVIRFGPADQYEVGCQLAAAAVVWHLALSWIFGVYSGCNIGRVVNYITYSEILTSMILVGEFVFFYQAFSSGPGILK